MTRPSLCDAPEAKIRDVHPTGVWGVGDNPPARSGGPGFTPRACGGFTNDLEIYHQVRAEALAGGGISMPLRNIIGMVDVLASTFSQDFDIEKACHALDQAIVWAEMLKTELRKAKDAI